MLAPLARLPRRSPLAYIVLVATLVLVIAAVLRAAPRNVIDDLEEFIVVEHEAFEPEVTAHDIEKKLAVEVAEEIEEIEENLGIIEASPSPESDEGETETDEGE